MRRRREAKLVIWIDINEYNVNESKQRRRQGMKAGKSLRKKGRLRSRDSNV